MVARFTGEARDAVRLAQAEARRLRHPAIGTEHLLLGLLAAGPNSAERALRRHGVDPAELRRRVLAIIGDQLDGDALAAVGIDLAAVRQATEATFGPGALDAPGGRGPTPGHLPLTRRGKKVVELALREAVHQSAPRIDSGHLLLALLREGHGIAALVLRAAGAHPAGLRAEVFRVLGTDAA